MLGENLISVEVGVFFLGGHHIWTVKGFSLYYWPFFGARGQTLLNNCHTSSQVTELWRIDISRKSVRSQLPLLSPTSSNLWMVKGGAGGLGILSVKWNNLKWLIRPVPIFFVASFKNNYLGIFFQSINIVCRQVWLLLEYLIQ